MKEIINTDKPPEEIKKENEILRYEIELKDSAVLANEAIIRALYETISAQNAIIQAQNSTILAKDATIQAQNSTILAKNATIQAQKKENDFLYKRVKEFEDKNKK